MAKKRQIQNMTVDSWRGPKYLGEIVALLAFCDHLPVSNVHDGSFQHWLTGIEKGRTKDRYDTRE
jgi:hypothetical protein